MPLLDHFHPPLAQRYPWESFHSSWATRIADQLTERMPPDFVVAEHTHAGNDLQIDVATFEQADGHAPSRSNGAPVATATAPSWAPPKATWMLPAIFPDTFEIRVFANMGGLVLVAAIELISPGNKDRPEQRKAFSAECASFLHQGVSVIIIDIVTSRRANLHNEIIRLVDEGAQFEMEESDELYAAAYRPVLRNGRAEIDIWPATFAIGDPLPEMPLRLTGDLFVPVDFEAAYEETCRRRRLA